MPFTARHSLNVARDAVGIATSMGADADLCRVILRAGLLYDIGKLGVSNRTLDKPAKLTDEEFCEIRKHPRWTWDILERVTAFDGFAQEAAQHHERLDGKGNACGETVAPRSIVTCSTRRRRFASPLLRNER